MEHESHEPQTPAITPSPWALPAGAARHDGWTGEKMAIFCEKLADTGIVADACLAAGKSRVSAYALRRRSPLFAAAWEAALVIARERLADTLLARSLEGTVEEYYRDGVLVGEKKLIDNRLGLAILRRLDRLAETGSPVSTRGERNVDSGAGRNPGQRASAAARSIDWDLALDALRGGEEAAIASALAMFEGDEVTEVNDPPNSLSQGDTDDTIDLSDRCWFDDTESVWMTDFPPPPDFEGWRTGDYGDSGYERACTADEVAILEADRAAETAAERAEDEALRDEWFGLLKSELPSEEDTNRHPGPFDAACGVAQDMLDPGSTFTSPAEE